MSMLGLCHGRSAELVGPQVWDTCLLLLCCPSILQAGITLLLLLSPWVEGKRLRAIAQGPGKPLTMQVCTMLSMQAGAGAEGIARLIREQRIYIVRKLWLAQESKA